MTRIDRWIAVLVVNFLEKGSDSALKPQIRVHRVTIELIVIFKMDCSVSYKGPFVTRVIDEAAIMFKSCLCIGVAIGSFNNHV
jgi:hypothetical protein